MCSLELWPLAHLFPGWAITVVLILLFWIGHVFYVLTWGGLTLRASRMFTSLIMKLEPCGAHTPGLHWSPNSIAPLINAQMMLADPLPFLFHILYSAAPSVSAVLVLFSELCSSTLSVLHHCVRPSVHCAYANNTWPIPARWSLYLREGHTYVTNR